jgi:hypothetical protein
MSWTYDAPIARLFLVTLQTLPMEVQMSTDETSAGEGTEPVLPTSRVTAGADREWVDQAARAALAARVRALSNASVQQHETTIRSAS